jgi:hypothetical protein
MRLISSRIAVGLVILVGPTALAQPPEQPEHAKETDEAQFARLAQELNNPISQVINVPFESNLQNGGGPMDNGFRYSLIAEPVVPVTITRSGWQLITRAVIPFVTQNDMFGNTSQTGLSDSTLAVYLSKPLNSFHWAPAWDWFRWGIGPILGVPTATEKSIGTGQWSIGPTGMVAYQRAPWTGGALASQLWSFAGDSMRPDVNVTLMQPFVGYTFGAGTSLRLSSETRYDWEAKQWTVPVIGVIAQMLKIEGVPVEISTGPIYTFKAPNIEPTGLGWRVTFTAVPR